jgi:hypothetical protein
VWSQRELHVAFSRADGAEQLTGYAAFDRDFMLAAAMIALPLLDNLDKANLTVWVAPSQRRQGIGGALLQHLVSTAVRGGRTTMLASSWLPGTHETTIRTAASRTSTSSPSPTPRSAGPWSCRCRTTGSRAWPPRRVSTTVLRLPDPDVSRRRAERPARADFQRIVSVATASVAV